MLGSRGLLRLRSTFDGQSRLLAVLAFLDRHEARVPVARENLLAALQSH